MKRSCKKDAVEEGKEFCCQKDSLVEFMKLEKDARVVLGVIGRLMGGFTFLRTRSSPPLSQVELIVLKRR